MTRKSKQAGGNMPLTSAERKKYSEGYGTTTARLNGISQYTFGDCALSLHSIEDHPVATPSGYVYEKAAILEYLLTKSRQLKKERKEYEAWLQKCETEQNEENEKKRKAQVEEFEEAQKVISDKRRKVDDNPLKRSSFWLAEFQPEAKGTNTMKAPPKRPPSPNSQKPLGQSDLILLHLRRNPDKQVVCGVSERPIKTQQAVALLTKKGIPAEVVLEKVFQDLGKDKMCPVTGRKITKVLRLQKGGSSFAASGGGSIEAKTYRPTMT